jgi:shikimate kinase
MGLSRGRIFLVGFMGAGKSTIGPRLACQLQWSFCDLDEQIEKEQGLSIRDIFHFQGEARFRELETEALKRTAQMNSTVIALGGGAFSSSGNREIVRQLGISVFLDCPFEVVLERCTACTGRPLFQEPVAVSALYQSRRPSYLLSDLSVEVGRQTPEQIVDIILDKIKEPC